MRTMIIALALVAGNAIAGEIVVETESYRITGHDCQIESMAWIEPPGRSLGKIGARGCNHYTLRLSGQPQPAQIEPHVTVGLVDLSVQHFECMVTGVSSDPKQIDVWCADGELFGRRE